MPPINKFRQIAAACDQLTTTPSNLVSGADLFWGRTLKTYNESFGPAGDLVCNVDLLLVDPFFLANSRAAPVSGYSCETGWPCRQGAEGQWRIGDGYWQGANRAGILYYYNNWHGNPNYYLLKLTARPVSPPPGIMCGLHSVDYATVWQYEVPVEHEYVVQKLNPLVCKIGNAILSTDDFTPPYMPGPKTPFWVDTSIHFVSTAKCMPEVLGYIRPESQILGAWAEMKLSDLQVYHCHVDFTGGITPFWNGYMWECLWNFSGWAYDEICTPPYPTGLSLIGIRSADNEPVVLQQGVVDITDIKSDQWCMVNMTEAARAMFRLWNGIYKGFQIIPFGGGGDLQLGLSDALAGPGGLARFRPSPAVSWSVSENGIPSSMSYSLDTYQYTFTTVDWRNCFVAYQLPGQTITRLLDYGTRPSLA